MNRVLGFLQSSAFRTALLVLALLAAVYAVAKNWAEVSDSLSKLPWWLVVIEILLAFAYVYLTMASWRVILNDVGEPVNSAVARRIFFSSQVAKYLPGGVWNFVAAAEVGKDYSISRRRSVCALLVSMVISIVGAIPNKLRSIDNKRSIADADSKLGVPPPINTVCIVRPQICGRW